ncbi:MAG: nucleotide sugar dehydrogenase [Planctomycetes bacterium]|nr:nucleotide sugar dehydrogenase [Planctomycetota bacterium]
MTPVELLVERIQNRTARTGVIGIGYVGLPLAVAMAKSGFTTTGIDVNPERVEGVRQGRSHVQDVNEDELRGLTASGKLTATTEDRVIEGLDAISICVPTPLRKSKDPDMSYIDGAVDMIGRNMRPGKLVVLESTTYPGTTEEVVLRRLQSGGLRVGVDFHLAFSPERIDPGNKRFHVQNTPKIVGGITPRCTEVAAFFYEQFIQTVVRVSSARTAEMVKLLENTFRSVNIGLVNEMALMCDKMGLDVWEIVDAAATKPFGFMPFYPGPGLGGHCLPIDPLYLSWKAKTYEFFARFIELASEINSSMPEHVFFKIVTALNQHRKSVNGAKILMLGVSYKRNVGDTRESPALDILQLLRRHGAELFYHDPFVPGVQVGDIELTCCPLEESTVRRADCVVLVTDHASIDLGSVALWANLIVDTRNAFKNVQRGREKIVKL